MKYINKKLTIEKVSVQNIAKKYSTPTYCYSYNQLKENINNFKKRFITKNFYIHETEYIIVHS